MKGLLLTGIAVSACIAALAHATPVGGPASMGGVYTSVHYIEEAGDLLGMEVNFRPGPSPTIVVTDCGGECFGGKAWPVKIDGRHISFTTYDESIEYPSGKLHRTPVTYSGQFRADGLLELTVHGNSDTPEVLKKVKHPRPHQVEQLGCQKDIC